MTSHHFRALTVRPRAFICSSPCSMLMFLFLPDHVTDKQLTRNHHRQKQPVSAWRWRSGNIYLDYFDFHSQSLLRRGTALKFAKFFQSESHMHTQTFNYKCNKQFKKAWSSKPFFLCICSEALEFNSKVFFSNISGDHSMDWDIKYQRQRTSFLHWTGTS